MNTQLTPGDVVEHEIAAPDPMMAMIERVVIDPNADLEKLERMLAMKERIDAKNAQIAFARALANARNAIPPIIKDATVGYENTKGQKVHYKHETLAGIAKKIDPILSENGLSYRFRTEQGNGGICVTCIIQHSDGHSEETSLSGAPDGSGSKNSFQAVGSAVTYLQRYTLKAALGLSAEVDDDGQIASPLEEAAKMVSPDQYIKLRDKALEAGVDEQRICEVAGAPSLQQFPADKFASAMRKLEKTIEANGHQSNDDLQDQIPDFDKETA